MRGDPGLCSYLVRLELDRERFFLRPPGPSSRTGFLLIALHFSMNPTLGAFFSLDSGSGELSFESLSAPMI